MTFFQKTAIRGIFRSTVRHGLKLSHVAVLAVVVGAGPAQGAEQDNVIRLTQTPCQFLESEGVDHKFKTTKKADCDAINAKSGADRLTCRQNGMVGVSRIPEKMKPFC